MACSTARDEELAAQGWTRHMMLDQTRLDEVVEQYQALGLEVRLEPVDPAACRAAGVCTACFEHPEAAAQLRVVYTRPAPSPPGQG